MKAEVARLLIGGTHSGCGKTTVTSALLQAFVKRGQTPAAFKCGPDYIDPMFHSEVIGAPSRNLDLFLCPPEVVCAQLVQHAKHAPLALLEGVMGYYDGVGGTTQQASSCDLACTTHTPSVLVVQAQGASLSLAAMIQGYTAFASNTIQGVILNGVSKQMYTYYKDIVETNTGIRVYGHLPRVEQAAIASRHLGLVTAGEIADLKNRLHMLAEVAADCIDLDGLLQLAQSAPPLHDTPQCIAPVCEKPVRIALARDSAFCFYYEDSLDVLRACGAQLIAFSPMADEALPENVDGIYLGGGYPELYLQALSENHAMRTAVARAITQGMPTFAECGGFLYLHESMQDAQGQAYPLVGVLPMQAAMQQRLQHFGYVTLTTQQDTLLGAKGEQIRAHEFHYYASSPQDGTACIAKKPLRNTTWTGVCASNTLFAGYPHIHFGGNISCAQSFVRCCQTYQDKKGR